jgi:hydrogenase nickel incorporation protein HypA/HybF
MHEMSIAQSLFEIVMEAVEGEGNVAVVERVDLRVGKLRAVVPDSLAFCFEVVCQGTRLEGAALRIEEVPVWVSCRDCRKVEEKTDPIFLCSRCGSPRIELVSGKELEITGIEVTDQAGGTEQ